MTGGTGVSGGTIAFVWLLIGVASTIHVWLVLSFRRVLERRRREATRLLHTRNSFDQYLGIYGVSQEGQQDGDQEPPEETALVPELFDAYYELQAYLLPLALNVLFSGVAVSLGLARIGVPLGWPDLASVASTVSAAAFAGLAGAYLWGLYDLLNRFVVSDLPGGALHSAWLRLLIAAPLGELCDRTFEGESLPLLLAFGLGAFPLKTIQELLVKKVLESWKFTPAAQEAAPPDLHHLQGLTKKIIDRLSEERIESVEHLAYTDPVKLIFKTGLDLTRALDLLDQALLYLFVGDKIEELRPIGIRGVIELADLQVRLESGEREARQHAEGMVKVLAEKLGEPAAGVRQLMLTVRRDSQVYFLWTLWGGAFDHGG